MNQMENVEPIVAFFDMHKSGARMAWEFCNPDYDVPRLIEHVEDRDLWRFSMGRPGCLGGVAHVSTRLRFVGRLLSRHVAARDRGRCCAARTREEHRGVPEAPLLDRGRRRQRAGRQRAVPLRQRYRQRAARCRARGAVRCMLVPARRWQVQWSLRSENGRVDVSEVAAKMGGGGHRNAAGFEQAA